MSSEFDNLVDVITQLVMAELAQASPGPAVTSIPAQQSGARVLLAPGEERVDSSLWKAVGQSAGVRPSVLVWNGFRADQIPSDGQSWKVEARTTHWSDVVSGYKAVVIPGCGLSVLASIGNLGAGDAPPAQAAVAALSSGLPVFLDNSRFEAFRRHSSRLPGGLVRRFEEFYRIVCSFGVEFGGPTELGGFLQKLGSSGGGNVSAPQSSSAGRDVITVEDVEAVRRSGQSKLPVAMGTIVTPLAAQRAGEWGIEVIFQ